METSPLLKKYNIAAPRYTSYPTVPYWEIENFNLNKWVNSVSDTYIRHSEDGISLYIHLPFCESFCTYCGCNTRITKNHAVEIPYINAVLKEWEMYVRIFGDTPKIKELHLGGGTPTFFSAENLEMLIQGIFNKAQLTDDAELSFEAHPANTSNQHLKKLYKLGFRRLSLGVQDFDPKVQFIINRIQSPEQVFQVSTEAKTIGYDSINFDLIYGLPAQTIDGLKATVNQVIGMRPERIAFYSYAHVPWLKPGQRHFTEKDLPAGDAKFLLYKTGKEMLLNAGYEDVGMDHFALKTDSLYLASRTKKLHRNFMGYTHQHTHLLIGLGVSSISDSWGAFAQNPKQVEAYLEKIKAESLAVEKGHILSPDDLKIRTHILEMMCQGETSFAERIPKHVKQRLTPLITDELIVVDGNTIRATTQGKSFIRNICMALDEKLWQKKPETQVFSSAI